MPVRRFRSVEEMTAPLRVPPLEGAGLRSAVGLSRICLTLDGRRRPAGVHKYRSAEDAWQSRLQWERSRPPV
jgi:hypothetical protein